MASAKKTKDHHQIKTWMEEHGGRPAVVKGTEGNESGAGLLRVKFDHSEDNLVDVDWNEFFATFDERGLSFLYQDQEGAQAQRSRFFKFIRE